MALDVSAFYEDAAHEAVVGAFFRTHCDAIGVNALLRVRNNAGGHGAMTHAVRSFFSATKRGEIAGDAFLIARDGNGIGVVERERELKAICEQLEIAVPIVYAIPEPHIEHWLLLDPHAIKTVFGVRFDEVAHHPNRGGYKNALAQVCVAANINSPTGGIEFADDIVAVANLQQIRQRDNSVDRFLRGIEALRALPASRT